MAIVFISFFVTGSCFTYWLQNSCNMSTEITELFRNMTQFTKNYQKVLFHYTDPAVTKPMINLMRNDASNILSYLWGGEETKKQGLTLAWSRWQKAFQSPGTVLSPQPRLDANSFMDWVGLALARYANDRNGFTASALAVGDVELTASALAGDDHRAEDAAAQDFVVRAYDAVGLAKLTATANPADAPATIPVAPIKQSAHHVDFAQVLGYQYPHQTATVTTAYQSVTDVKRVFEDDDPRLGMSRSAKFTRPDGWQPYDCPKAVEPPAAATRQTEDEFFD